MEFRELLKLTMGLLSMEKNINDIVKHLEQKLKFSTPLWPHGNAEAERFMQPLAKALKTAKIDQRPWKQELQRFLLQYRTTPHCSTGVPPAELLFNRTVQGQLPTLEKHKVVNTHKEERQNEKKDIDDNDEMTKKE